jgi:hypothetical protein
MSYERLQVKDEYYEDEISQQTDSVESCGSCDGMVVHEVQGQETGHHPLRLASHHVHFVDDQEFNPLAYAEQFEDSDPTKGQSSEELLRKARMLISGRLFFRQLQ